MQELVKAYGYMRVSGQSQVDGDGFPRQQAAIAEYAEKHGYDVVHYFRDEAVPGKTETQDRPAFAEMRAAMVTNGVKTVIFEKLDRLARDQMVQEAAIRDFHKYGLTMISVYEPDLCQNDPTRKLLRTFIGAISEYEKDMIVSKLSGARKRMRDREGRCEGAKPYGKHPDFPAESEVLAQMQQWDRDGMSVTEITKRLNDQGILPRRGKKWHHYTVTRILGHYKFKGKQ